MWPSGLRHELAKFTDFLESHRFESYHFRMTHFVHSSLNHKDICSFHTRQSFPSFLKDQKDPKSKVFKPMHPTPPSNHSITLLRKNKIFRRSLSNRWHLRSSTQYGMIQRRFHTFQTTNIVIRAKRIHLYVPIIKDDFQFNILRKRMVENGIDICYTRKGRRMVPVAIPCLPCRRIQKRSKFQKLSYQELDLRITSPVKPWWPTTRKST